MSANGANAFAVPMWRRSPRGLGTNGALLPSHNVATIEGGTMLYWIAYGIPTIVLLIALIYAVNRAGWFSPREERQLDANTRMAQERDEAERRETY
jgi:hypothetical protein